MKTLEEIRLDLDEGLEEHLLIGVHTHIDASHIPAHGLHDLHSRILWRCCLDWILAQRT